MAEEKINLPEYFKDAVCIITGASTGIGYGLGVRLLEYGATVYFTARTQSKLDEDAELQKKYVDAGKAFFQALDVTDPDAVEALINAVKEKHGRIDYLFNNAGIGSAGLTERASLRAWDRILKTNLWGVIHGVHAVLPIMIAQQSGHIINTASIQGLLPAPFQTLYSTSKHAVVGLSESLNYEMACNNVHVSVLCPGAVATEIFKKGGQPDPADAISIWESADWALERIAKKQCIIPVAKIADDAYVNYRLHPERFEADYMHRAEVAKAKATDNVERLKYFLEFSEVNK